MSIYKYIGYWLRTHRVCRHRLMNIPLSGSHTRAIAIINCQLAIWNILTNFGTQKEK